MNDEKGKVMKISDELREWVDVHCGEECEEYLGLLADRIDREMVELPKDADGVPIHVGDTVWGYASGIERVVAGMNLTDEWALFTDSMCIGRSTDVTHERPDSFERIADDIERAKKWCDKSGGYGTGISSVAESTLREWADRIRKLAKEERDGD